MPEPEASGAAWVYLLNTCSLLLPVTVHGVAIELPCVSMQNLRSMDLAPSLTAIYCTALSLGALQPSGLAEQQSQRHATQGD